MIEVTAAATGTLVSLADTKEYLGISGTDSDVKLTKVLERVTAAVETFCGRVLRVESVRETLRLNAGDLGGSPVEELFLDRWPVTSVTSVTEDGTALVAADYELDAETGGLRRLDGSDEPDTWYPGKVVVEYQAGYSTIPADLQRAALAIIKLDWLSADRDPSVKSEEVPGVLVQEFWVGGSNGLAGLPKDIEGMLFPYKRLP